jgi:hypothetical protein
VEHSNASLICKMHFLQIVHPAREHPSYRTAVQIQQSNFYPARPFNAILARKEANFESMRLTLWDFGTEFDIEYLIQRSFIHHVNANTTGELIQGTA